MPHTDTDTGGDWSLFTPDDRVDWSLYLWAAVTIAVAMVTQLPRQFFGYFRYRLCGALYAAANALNDAPPLPDARLAKLTERLMRAVEAEAARDRGGAT